MDKKNKQAIYLPVFVIVLLLFLFQINTVAQEDTNTPQPKRTGNISDEVVEHESGYYYTVKKGDTLWGLSRKFANTPYYWPDLWSGNSDISNPHMIYPGMRIRLYLKKDVEHYIEPEIPVPPPIEDDPIETTAPVAVVKTKPPEKPREYFNYSMIDMVGFIREKPAESHGIIFKTQSDKKFISSGDTIYINQSVEDSLLPGSRFRIFRTLKPIKDKKTNIYYGYQHIILGIAEITRLTPDFAIAKVIQSIRKIQVNDHLMPYNRRSQKILKHESQPDLLGKIIIAEERVDIIGDNIIVFIDRGEEHGVKPGQTYSLFYQVEGKIKSKKNKKVILNKILLGSIIILHTEKKTSTAYIIKVEKEIPPNTRICTPFF